MVWLKDCILKDSKTHLGEYNIGIKFSKKISYVLSIRLNFPLPFCLTIFIGISRDVDFSFA